MVFSSPNQDKAQQVLEKSGGFYCSQVFYFFYGVVYVYAPLLKEEKNKRRRFRGKGCI